MKATTLYCLAFVLVILIGLAIYPRAITGDYATVTIDKIEITSDGRVDISYSGKCSSGHYISSVYIEEGRPASEGGGISGSIGLGYPVAFKVEQDRWSPSRVENLKDQLQIREGGEYVITSDEPLVLFNLDAELGRHNKGILKLARQDSFKF